MRDHRRRRAVWGLKALEESSGSGCELQSQCRWDNVCFPPRRENDSPQTQWLCPVASCPLRKHPFARKRNRDRHYARHHGPLRLLYLFLGCSRAKKPFLNSTSYTEHLKSYLGEIIVATN